MKDFQTILQEKIDYYGKTEAAYELAAEEYARQLFQSQKVEFLEQVKIGFDICSDYSTLCLGYRNLVDRIRREKENIEKTQIIDKTISPIKPYKNE